MTDHELDQMLNQWKAPAPPAGLRARVLSRFPRVERMSFRRPLRWGLGLAAATCVIALGMGQTGHFSLENVANGVMKVHNDAFHWVDRMWWDHITAHYFDSHPAVYVDGEARSDVRFHGRSGGMWVEIPGETRYAFIIGYGGHKVEAAGKFDGHVLEFHAGGHLIHVESEHTYGFGGEKGVYVIGPQVQQ
jgi:hypothetical protein